MSFTLILMILYKLNKTSNKNVRKILKAHKNLAQMLFTITVNQNQACPFILARSHVIKTMCHSYYLIVTKNFGCREIPDDNKIFI